MSIKYYNQFIDNDSDDCCSNNSDEFFITCKDTDNCYSSEEDEYISEKLNDFVMFQVSSFRKINDRLYTIANMICNLQENVKSLYSSISNKDLEYFLCNTSSVLFSGSRIYEESPGIIFSVHYNLQIDFLLYQKKCQDKCISLLDDVNIDNELIGINAHPLIINLETMGKINIRPIISNISITKDPRLSGGFPNNNDFIVEIGKVFPLFKPNTDKYIILYELNKKISVFSGRFPNISKITWKIDINGNMSLIFKVRFRTLGPFSYTNSFVDDVSVIV